MAIQERLYDIGEVWDLYCQPDNELKRFELIDGVLFEMSGPGGTHGRIATKLARFLDEHAENNDLGIVTVETGYHPQDNRFTLLLPDVAFVSEVRAPKPFPEKFVPIMPDLAIEIYSPSNTFEELREKAQVYFRHGTKLVWIVIPAQRTIEVHRPQVEIKTLGPGDTLDRRAMSCPASRCP